MKVILLGELRGKGGEGDVIDVAQGYAENYLIPKKIAILATKGNLKQLEERRNNIAKREVKRMADANALKEQLDGKNITIDAKVGEEGQLFGSVTSAMVVAAIQEQLGVEFDRRRVELNNPIKVLGNGTLSKKLTVQLHAFTASAKEMIANAGGTVEEI